MEAARLRRQTRPRRELDAGPRRGEAAASAPAGRLAHGSRFDVAYDAAAECWSGTLTVPAEAETEPAIFSASASGVFHLLRPSTGPTGIHCPRRRRPTRQRPEHQAPRPPRIRPSQPLFPPPPACTMPSILWPASASPDLRTGRGAGAGRSRRKGRHAWPARGRSSGRSMSGTWGRRRRPGTAAGTSRAAAGGASRSAPASAARTTPSAGAARSKTS